MRGVIASRSRWTCLAACAAALLALAPVAVASSPGQNPRGRVLGVVHAGARAPSSSAARRLGPLTAEAPLTYHGGPVVHNGHVYAIFWEPPGYSFPSDYKAAVARYFSGVAADSGKHTNVYSVDRQYGDSVGAAAYNVTFSGAYTDTAGLPSSDCSDPATSLCLSDPALTDELSSFVAAHGLPGGLANQYFLFTPPGVGSCYDDGTGPQCAFDVWCAYHSWLGSGSGATLYAIHPFVAGDQSCDAGESPNHSSADPTLNLVSHEHNEMITDPVGDGWYDQDGNENGDKCAWTWGALFGAVDAAYNQVIAGTPYLLQQEWSNQDGGCVTSYGTNQMPIALFQRVGTAVARSPVHFTAATSHDPDGRIVSYSWRFGDGTTGTGVSPAHTYARRGTYRVQLTVTDDQGGTATRTLGVVVQPRPNPHPRPARRKKHRRKHHHHRPSAALSVYG
jgi:chitodextrinase